MPERDDLLLLLLNIVPLMAYLLLIFITAEAIFATIFDSLLIVAAYFLLFQVKDEHDEGILKFDENLSISGVMLAIGLGLVTFLVNVAVFSYASPNTLLSVVGKQLSVIYTPSVLSLNNLPVYSLVVGILSVFLVAIAETGLVGAASYGLVGIFGRIDESFDSDHWGAVITAIVISTAEWAILHTIRAGFGELQVTMAFISGMIWFVGWLATKSIITMIISHLEYDALILSLVVLSGVTAIAFVIVITILAVVSLSSYLYAKMNE